MKLKGKTIIEVTLPMLILLVPLVHAVPAQSKVTGDGWIPSPSKEGNATFAFVAMQYEDGNLKGKLDYVDQVLGIDVHGYEITGLSIWDDFTKAYFGGNCKINGEDGFTFGVYVEDNEELGGKDLFIMTLSNGYSNIAVLGGGSIQIHIPP